MILLGMGPRARDAWRRLAQLAPSSSSDANVGGLPGGPLRSPPLLSRDDFVMSLLLSHLWLSVRSKGPEAWPAEAARVSRDVHAMLAPAIEPFVSHIPARLPDRAAMNPDDLSKALFARFVQAKIEVLQAFRRKQEPLNVRLEGAEYLRTALEGGRGALLWCEACFSSSLYLKSALASAGFQVHHLSRPDHDLSQSRFGRRFLNPIVQKPENRYIAERIMNHEGAQLAVSRRIMELLKANAVVSITVAATGSQLLRAPFMDGTISVASGAPHFAQRSGAPLLPVYTHGEGDGYVVEIDKPIELQGLPREAAYQHAVEELVRRLDDFVREHPLDWEGWLTGTYTEAPVPA